MNTALSSWKEIAAYLGKGVRTVQRWERQFGLPVRRPNSKSHVIFAIPEELDIWIRKHQRSGEVPQLSSAVLADAQKRRVKQQELLEKLRSAYEQLEANEQVLSQNINRLMAAFRNVNVIAARLSETRRKNGSLSSREPQSKGNAA